MEVSIWLEDKDDYVEVDVPMYDIAKIIGKRYGVTAEAMLEIIKDYDIDVSEDIDNTDEIKELAENIYWRYYA